jgi:hypothetical protein
VSGLTLEIENSKAAHFFATAIDKEFGEGKVTVYECVDPEVFLCFKNLQAPRYRR